MAHGTIGWESGLDVIGVGGAVVILGVTGITIGGSAGEFPIDVALVASDADVPTREREFREFCVIEDGSHPSSGVMAGGAIRGEARLNVIGIGGGLEIFRVATVTIRGRTFELSADVARGTFERDVGTGESESRKFQVIKFRANPGVDGVAALAGGGKAQGFMVR